MTLTFCAIRSLWDGYMLPFTFSVAWFPRCDTGQWCSHNFATQCLLMSTSEIILLWWPQEGNNLKLQAVITDEPDISNIHDTVQGSSYLIKHRFEFKLGHGWLICMWRAAIYLNILGKRWLVFRVYLPFWYWGWQVRNKTGHLCQWLNKIITKTFILN